MQLCARAKLTKATTNPYSKTVQQNWIDLKDAINTSVVKHVPFKTIHSNPRLPWTRLNAEIKKDMKKRKHLYNIAKRTRSEDDWKAYRSLKNSINSKIKIRSTL